MTVTGGRHCEMQFISRWKPLMNNINWSIDMRGSRFSFALLHREFKFIVNIDDTGTTSRTLSLYSFPSPPLVRFS